MFETLGAPELLIIGLLVVLLFGAGKVGKVGKELGTSVKEFRRAIREDDAEAPGSVPGAGANVGAQPATAAGGPAEPAAPGPRIF